MKRRLSTNAVLSASVLVLTFALSFATTPILVRGLGEDAYGIYALVLGFINYSFTYGIAKAASKYVAEYRAANDLELVNESVSTAFWFSLLLGVVSAVVIIIFSDTFVDVVLRIPAELISEGRVSIRLAGGIILGFMLTQVWSFTLQGLHRFDRYAMLSAASTVALNLGAVYVVWLGYGVSTVLLWNLIVAFLMAISFAMYAKWSLPSLRLTFRVRPHIRRSVVSYGSAVILSQIFGNVLLLFERTWITRSFGVDAVTYYAVPMMLALILHSFVGSIVIVLFPVVNERLSDTENVAAIYRSSTKSVLAVTVFAFVCSAVLGKFLLAVWVGEEFAARSSDLLAFHTATFGLLAAATMAWNVAESFGRSRVNVIFSLCWLIVGGSLMIPLGGWYGLEGVGIARLIGVFGVVPLAVFVEHRILGSFRLNYWLLTGARLIPAAAAAAAVEWLISIWITGIAALILGSAAGAAIYLLILWGAGYFSTEELTWLRRSIPLARA